VSATRLAFALPASLEASEPPEARGIARDHVRLLVAHRCSGELRHTTFDRLATFLEPGDLVVVNTSATIPAALDARAEDGEALVLHLSTQLDDDRWVVERRRGDGVSTARWPGPEGPTTLRLGAGATAHLDEPYLGSTRLFVARLSLPAPTLEWLSRHGRPIRYGYVPRPWPLSSYQTVYATEPGSAEMPSAGRPFTADVLTRLVARGVGVTPIVLHTGVASLEADERPYPERASVPAWTASRVNETRASGGRVIAVGTTVVRALETAATPSGTVAPYEGWTDLVVGPERPIRVVDGILTGWHEPETSHLQLLEAIAGHDVLERSYAAAVAEGYRFHEFGDSHLLVP
jgi:S-adenosylmethionine:tRNA ribosyltransferase-isomerase